MDLVRLLADVALIPAAGLDLAAARERLARCLRAGLGDGLLAIDLGDDAAVAPEGATVVPLAAGACIAGRLVFAPHAPVPLDAAALDALGRAVAAALDHAALHAAVATRASRDRELLLAARFAAASTDADAVLTRFAGTFARVSGAARVTIAVPHPDAPDTQFAHRAMVGLLEREEAFLRGVPVRRSFEPIRRAFETDAVTVYDARTLDIEVVRAYFERCGELHHAVVPLSAHGAVVGVGLLSRRCPFEADALAALDAMRHELALAIRSASERDAARRAAERETIIAEVRGLIGQALPVVLEGITDRVGRALGAGLGVLALVDPTDSRTVVIRHEHRAPGTTSFLDLRLPADRLPAAGTPFIACVDVTRDPTRAAGAPALAGVTAFLLAPIVEGATLRGALIAAEVGRPRTWTDDEARLVRAAAEHAALAIARAAVDDEVRRRGEEHEATISHMTDGVVIFDAGLAPRRVNAAAQELCWLPPDADGEALRRGYDALSTHDRDGRRLAPDELPIARAVRCGEVVRNRELFLRRPDGAERAVVYGASPLRDAAGRLTGGVLFLRDVTAERAATAHAARVENLRVAGELAAGVAHEANNALAAVLGRAGLLARATRETDTRRGLEVIAQAARDASETLGRLTRLSRRTGTRLRQVVDLRAAAADAIELTRPRWARPVPGGVATECTLEPGAPVLVQGVARELREVFTNLILNAVDARAKRIALALRADAPTGLARAEVQDDGVGMTDEVLRHALEPFFTTKGESGTGLGLSITSAVAEAHGGRLELSSTPGRGTTIAVVLPLAPLEPVAAAELGPGDVLVVDDDPRVRSILAAILADGGQRVLAFASGEEALAHLALHEAPRLLVTDLLMPGMPGWVLAEQVHARSPSTAIVFVSGWLSHAPEDVVERLGVTVVEKPFEPEAVRLACGQAIRARAGAL